MMRVSCNETQQVQLVPSLTKYFRVTVIRCLRVTFPLQDELYFASQFQAQTWTREQLLGCGSEANSQCLDSLEIII